MATQTYEALDRAGSPSTVRERTYDDAHTHLRISWQAIIAGVVLAIGVQLVLSMLGVGIGLGMVHTGEGSTPGAASFSLGAGLWWLISSLVALAVGGYVAAWLAGVTERFDGILHGLVTWGITALITVYLLTSAVGGLIGGAFNAVGTTLSSVGSGVSNAAPQMAEAVGVSPDAIQKQVQAYLQPTNPDPSSMTAEDAQKAIASELASYVGGGAGAPAAKERIIDIMAAQMKVDRNVASQRFDELQARAMATKDKAVGTAKDVADKSASSASTASYFAFGALVLGALIAAIAGSMAVQRRLLIGERTTDLGRPTRA